jgi:DNA-binding response OmpR family regulator
MPVQDASGISEPKSEIGLILVIEDDPRMQKVLKRIFAGENYAVEIAGDGKTGMELFLSHRPMAVLLDLILPQVSGRELCQEIKSISPETPVIVLSAISEISDKVLLLEIGADDYVTKPFSPRELLARVQAAIRRCAPLPQSSIFRFGECEIDFDKMTAKRAGEPVVLTSHEFKLVRFFMENPQRVLSRELLLNQVWGYNSYPTTRTVDNQILKVRQRLERDPGNPKHFLTVFGRGYKFVRD